MFPINLHVTHMVSPDFALPKLEEKFDKVTFVSALNRDIDSKIALKLLNKMKDKINE